VKHSAIIVCAVVAALLSGSVASAQILPPGTTPLSAPLPPPLPQPKIAPAVIPQMDAPVSQSYAPAPSPSFSDRISTCLDQAAASGFGPGDRETYSRSCANQ
jgi:hypothetical protein